MQTRRSLALPEINKLFKVSLLSLCLLQAGQLTAQEESQQLHTVLDIESLYEPVESQDIHGETAIELLQQLQTKHYASLEIDDNFSALVFDSYLDTLDGAHLYFMRDDINKLSAYRYTLDDSLKDGSVEPGFEIYNQYYRRVLERLIYAINRVENHIPDMDFTIDETILIDREEAPYSDTVAQLDDVWRKRVKNSVLSLKLT
ncbi:MAG: hypothetical protein AB8B95_01255, partial [Pseudohongiellaceae bacterium]